VTRGAECTFSLQTRVCCSFLLPPLAAHLTARWCDGIVPAIGGVAHGGPTGLVVTELWCRWIPTWFLFEDGGEAAVVVAVVA